ncbi:MAG: hypothetical protein ACR2P9_03440 [Gammaproteobacteria bacterium]
MITAVLILAVVLVFQLIEAELVPSEVGTPAPAVPPTASPAETARTAAMRQQYAALEQARTELRRRLAGLKAQTWNLRLPPDQARQITTDMRQAHALLRNPPLLGAFADADGIKREQDKVTNSITTMQQIQQRLTDLKPNRQP